VTNQRLGDHDYEADCINSATDAPLESFDCGTHFVYRIHCLIPRFDRPSRVGYTIAYGGAGRPACPRGTSLASLIRCLASRRGCARENGIDGARFRKAGSRAIFRFSDTLSFEVVRIATHRSVQVAHIVLVGFVPLWRAVGEIFRVLFALRAPCSAHCHFKSHRFVVARVTGAERGVVCIFHAVDFGRSGGNFSGALNELCAACVVETTEKPARIHFQLVWTTSWPIL